ncbi:Predicted amidohydrolase [Parafilimonas terrae]|uniref:Predicted amidohydrolase n=2 Tax=Parafilimonas terrae TaxID=1465490 RepID=A0A1I5VNW9_9BACT|nr:Predicted amidohydrolase [Parafilimonas terrae]
MPPFHLLYNPKTILSLFNMKIALASPLYPASIYDAIKQLQTLVEDAARQKAAIICFPETYIPGYPLDLENVKKTSPEVLKDALQKACEIARANSIAIILPMDWYEDENFLNVAFVISGKGNVAGYQPKVQLDPSEDNVWVAGKGRQLFEVQDLKFGIAICHEGFRYPETVRWAARQGASIVFHPHFAGSDTEGIELKEWGNAGNPYYEKAMMMRSIENTIYFASVNYATRFQESATSLISPDGKCIAWQLYGKAGILVADIEPELATGRLAKRLKINYT